MFSSLFNALRSSSLSRHRDGFTLTELLVAGALTATVVGVSGVGIASVLSSSTDSGNQNERRIELNRSLDFIAAEVRQALTIEPDADLGLATSAPAFGPSFPTNDKVPVLTLKIPGVSQPVIYYVAAATGPWRGPKAVYRWGPGFDDQGSYTDANNPSAWQAQPLIDLISDQGLTPTCETGWQLNPPNPTGFYACVNQTGKIASVHANGHLRKILGEDETYPIETKVFARITQTANPTFPGLPISSVSTRINTLSTVTISTLGGAIQCGGSRTLVPVSGAVEFSPASNNGPTTTQPLPDAPDPPDGPRGDIVQANVPPNTTLAITGKFNNCGRSISVHSGTDQGNLVLTLRNGDTLPAFTPYREQREISKFLDAKNPINGGQPYLTAVTDPQSSQTSYRVSLASNQLIFLFELGVDYDNSRSVDDQEAGFDMQDLVVVATITPTTETIIQAQP
jgi:type II secretory pathway pseudopilin PulG